MKLTKPESMGELTNERGPLLSEWWIDAAIWVLFITLLAGML